MENQNGPEYGASPEHVSAEGYATPHAMNESPAEGGGDDHKEYFFKVVIAVVVLVAIGLVAYGAYYLATRQDEPKVDPRVERINQIKAAIGAEAYTEEEERESVQNLNQIKADEPGFRKYTDEEEAQSVAEINDIKAQF